MTTAPRSLPQGWWKDQHVCSKLAELFQKHLAILMVPFRSKGDPSIKHEVFTGVVLEVDSTIFWVTAGHVIKSLRAIQDDPDTSVGTLSLLDGFPESDCPVRLAQEIPTIEIDDGNYDIGLIPLRRFYADQIRANCKLSPINPTIWLGHEGSNPEGFFLVGAPYSWNNLVTESVANNESKCRYCIPVACAPVEQIEDRGKTSALDAFWGKPESFYGVVHDFVDPSGRALDDIRGMSGGPILSIERTDDGQLKYRLFAIQSRWLPKSRIIRASPISSIETALAIFYEQGATFRGARIVGRHLED